MSILTLQVIGFAGEFLYVVILLAHINACIQALLCKTER